MKHGLQGIGNLYANIFFIEFFFIQPLYCTIYIYFAMRLKQKNSLTDEFHWVVLHTNT